VNRHGKYVCRARDPDCPECPLRENCPSAKLFGKSRVQPPRAGDAEAPKGKGGRPLSPASPGGARRLPAPGSPSSRKR
jgi:hypothetical protein